MVIVNCLYQFFPYPLQCASRDSITANALQVLHEHEYEAGKAIQHLLKTPFPRASMGDIQHRWPEEDQKQFIKGLRTYGKDFFKIRVDFLPDKGELYVLVVTDEQLWEILESEPMNSYL